MHILFRSITCKHGKLAASKVDDGSFPQQLHVPRARSVVHVNPEFVLRWVPRCILHLFCGGRWSGATPWQCQTSTASMKMELGASVRLTVPQLVAINVGLGP